MVGIGVIATIKDTASSPGINFNLTELFGHLEKFEIVGFNTDITPTINNLRVISSIATPIVKLSILLNSSISNYSFLMKKYDEKCQIKFTLAASRTYAACSGALLFLIQNPTQTIAFNYSEVKQDYAQRLFRYWASKNAYSLQLYPLRISKSDVNHNIDMINFLGYIGVVHAR